MKGWAPLQITSAKCVPKNIGVGKASDPGAAGNCWLHASTAYQQSWYLEQKPVTIPKLRQDRPTYREKQTCGFIFFYNGSICHKIFIIKQSNLIESVPIPSTISILMSLQSLKTCWEKTSLLRVPLSLFRGSIRSIRIHNVCDSQIQDWERRRFPRVAMRVWSGPVSRLIH